MTIGELIEELNKFDKDLKVGGEDVNFGSYLYIEEIKLIENRIDSYVAIKIIDSQDID
jgi:hypothetical protein